MSATSRSITRSGHSSTTRRRPSFTIRSSRATSSPTSAKSPARCWRRGKTATAAYCFAGPEHDQNTGQEWLAQKDIKFAKLEPARLTAYKQVTAKASKIAFGAAGPLTIRAEAGKKLPTMDILVYSGGKVQPAGCPVPIVLNCAGIRTNRNQAPVVLNHDPDLVVGHGLPQISSAQVRLTGPVSGTGAGRQASPGDRLERFRVASLDRRQPR